MADRLGGAAIAVLQRKTTSTQNRHWRANTAPKGEMNT